MALIRLLVFLQCSLTLIDVVHSWGLMGPYDFIRLDNVESCPVKGEPCDLMDVELKMKGSAAGRVATGFWKAPHPVGAGILGNVVVFQWLNGWRRIFKYDVTKDICEEGMNTAPDLMSIMANSSGVPSKCPFPEGHHEIVDFPLNFKLEKFPNMPYGRFRIQVNLEKNKKPFGCYFLEGNIDPAAKKNE